MKINLLNKLYIGFAFLLVAGSVYNIVTYKSWAREYYYSSVCAPPSFPVYFHACYFITGHKDDYAWINEDQVNDFRNEWGDEGFAEVHDPMLLPEKLVLQYASYRDRKFYSDTVDLPVQTIKQIFKDAKLKNQLEEIYKPGNDVLGLKFLVGVANNGHIIVWLRGRHMDQVVLKTQLQAKEPEGDETYHEKLLSKAQYLEKVFEGLSDSLKTKIKSGWDRNASYIDTPTHYLERNKYRWEK